MDIWQIVLDRFPSGMVIICTIFAVLIPMCLYWISDQLHKYGDPPWKKT